MKTVRPKNRNKSGPGRTVITYLKWGLGCKFDHPPRPHSVCIVVHHSSQSNGHAHTLEEQNQSRPRPRKTIVPFIPSPTVSERKLRENIGDPEGKARQRPTQARRGDARCWAFSWWCPMAELGVTNGSERRWVATDSGSLEGPLPRACWCRSGTTVRWEPNALKPRVRV